MSTVESFQVNAVSRSDEGKGASRRLRRQGLVPGVLYGGHQDAISISARFNEMTKHLESEAFYSHVLTVNVEGQAPVQAVLKDVQRHPASGNVSHFDLLRVSATEKLTLSVPLHFINEEACVGVKLGGGKISHQLNEVQIRCLPKDLPEFIEVDVKALEAGQVLHLSDLALPADVELVELSHGESHDQPVVSVLSSGGAQAEEGEAEAE